MKAILMIEVPDDFKKGECLKCPLRTSHWIMGYSYCPAVKGLIPLSTDYVCIGDCPLERQENIIYENIIDKLTWYESQDLINKEYVLKRLRDSVKASFEMGFFNSGVVKQKIIEEIENMPKAEPPKE